MMPINRWFVPKHSSLADGTSNSARIWAELIVLSLSFGVGGGGVGCGVGSYCAQIWASHLFFCILLMQLCC